VSFVFVIWPEIVIVMTVFSWVDPCLGARLITESVADLLNTYPHDPGGAVGSQTDSSDPIPSTTVPGRVDS
jgi:hypothetical protein